jgi:hypothetical protein
MLLALPCLDQKKRNRAGRVDGKPRDAGIDAAKAFLPAVRVAGVRSQRADALGDRSQSAEHLTDVVLDFGR